MIILWLDCYPWRSWLSLSFLLLIQGQGLFKSADVFQSGLMSRNVAGTWLSVALLWLLCLFYAARNHLVPNICSRYTPSYLVSCLRLLEHAPAAERRGQNPEPATCQNEPGQYRPEEARRTDEELLDVGGL